MCENRWPKTKLTLRSSKFFSTGRNWIVRLMNLNDKSVKIAGKTYNNLTCAPRPGGTHIGKGYGDVPRSWPHFFRPVAAPGRRSLAYQFTVNAPLLCPLFSIFRKFLHFQPCFSQNFSSLDPNFSKFSFPRPQFFKEKPLPIPYIRL